MAAHRTFYQDIHLSLDEKVAILKFAYKIKHYHWREPSPPSVNYNYRTDNETFTKQEMLSTFNDTCFFQILKYNDAWNNGGEVWFEQRYPIKPVHKYRITIRREDFESLVQKFKLETFQEPKIEWVYEPKLTDCKITYR